MRGQERLSLAMGHLVREVSQVGLLRFQPFDEFQCLTDRQVGRVWGLEAQGAKIGAALPDTAPLEALLVRTVYAGVEDAPAPRLVSYVLAQRQALAIQPLAGLLAGQVAWSAP